MTQTTIAQIQTLASMQTYISELRNIFPAWPEVKKVEKNLYDLEAKVAAKVQDMDPELLNLVGAGEFIQLEEEKEKIRNYLKQAYLT